jgi:hypothetical protein
MKAFFKLNVKQLVGRAMSAIEPLTPIQYVYSLHTRDLRNVSPANMLFDNKGNRLAGRFASTDITNGFPSPVIWSWFWPVVLLSVLGAVLLSLAAVFGVWIPVKAFSASYMAQGSGIGSSVLKASLDAYIGMVSITAVAMIPTWVMSYYGYLIVAEAEPTRMAHHAYWLLIGVPSIAVVLVPVLGPAAAAVVTLVFPWVMYWLRLNAMELARHNALRDASESAKGLTGLPDANVHERQRKAQAEKAFNDKLADGRPAPLMTLGVETGWVREETGNPLSADKGAVVGISLGEDSSTHIWFFGNTGSGKTSGGFKRAIKAWRDNKMGGQLVVDAKGGSLPIEMHAAGLITHLVWPAKGTKINLMASLNPVAFAHAMAKCFSDHSKASVFDGSTRIYIACAASLIRFAVRHGVPGVRNSFGYLDTFCTNPDERTRVLEFMAQNMKDEFKAKPSLKKAHYQWAMRYPNLPNETRGSVDFTMDVWLKELTTNEEIGDMLTGDDGVDVADLVCRGESVGIVLSEKDGYAGRLALTLIKTAVFSRIKARSQIPNWRALGETDVQVVVDECAPVIEDLDEEAASQLRSLGARMVYGTQSYDQVVNRLGGEREANAFLDSFKSIGTFNASGAGDAGMAGTYAYISSRVGSVYRLDKHNTDITAVALDKSVAKTRASGLENKRLGGIADMLSSLTTTVAEMRRSLSLSPQSLAERKDRMRLAASETYQLRLLPAIMPEEFTYLLKGTHKFAGVLSRGTVGRVVTLDMTPGIEQEPDERTVAFFQQRIELARQRALGASAKPMGLPSKQHEEVFENA